LKTAQRKSEIKIFFSVQLKFPLPPFVLPNASSFRTNLILGLPIVMEVSIEGATSALHRLPAKKPQTVPWTGSNVIDSSPSMMFTRKEKDKRHLLLSFTLLTEHPNLPIDRPTA